MVACSLADASGESEIHFTTCVYRRSLGKTPYFGAKSMTVEKISPAITAIMPELEVSAKPNQAGTIKALRCPSTAEPIAMSTLSSTINQSRSVSRCAVAAGTMSIAITMILPTASKAATVVTATSVIKR